MSDAFRQNGWIVLAQDVGVQAWARAAHAAAITVTADPGMQARWLRHGGTWFVGVDALPNAADGSIGGAPLPTAWHGMVRPPETWHRAQLSVVHPGYPGRDRYESEAGHRFRKERDAAHLDGLIAIGPDKRRFLREPHAFILGLPLTAMTAETGAFVIWEGSHRIVNAAFRAAFDGVPATAWADRDVTAIYQAARREVFDLCPRRLLIAQPGAAILVHRQAIHGSAPWTEGAQGPTEGRMIAWFRPVLDDPVQWLEED